MKARSDPAGRIVVPKPVRQALGLKPGQPLEIRAGDGRLEIEIASTPMQLKKRGKGLVAVPDAKLPPLTAEQVRDTLERVRREEPPTPGWASLPSPPGPRNTMPRAPGWTARSAPPSTAPRRRTRW